jgi:hypothetical protein
MKIIVAAGLLAYLVQPKEHIQILLLLLAGRYISQINDRGISVVSKHDSIHLLVKISEHYYGGSRYTATKTAHVNKNTEKEDS